MSNAIYEQFGYASARDLMTELARDISDGGDLIAVVKSPRSQVKECGWKFDGGYWYIMYGHGRVVTISYCDTVEELIDLMGA